MPSTNFGDISPVTHTYVAAEFLKNGTPFVVTEPWCQADTIPLNETDTITYRRYLPLDPTPKVLDEVVTPNAAKMTHEDVSATLKDYYGGVQLSRKVMDHHTDPVMQIAVGLLGEQGAEMAELVRLGEFVAGTQVMYGGSALARNEVVAPLDLNLHRNCVRLLERRRAKPHTKAIRSTTAYGTQAVEKCFVGWVHTDAKDTIRDLPGFIDPKNYGTVSPYPNEIGTVSDVRYFGTDLLKPFADAGGDVPDPAMLSTSGVKCDVYPILYVGRDSLATIALKGKMAKNNNGQNEPVVPVTIMITNPKPSDSDPWAQRGWATYTMPLTALILQDLWLVRAEVAVPA